MTAEMKVFSFQLDVMSIQTFELSGLLDECDLALLNVSISCFDLEQDNLFIGTTNGQVIQFSIATNSRKSAVFSTEHLATTKLPVSSRISNLFCSLSISAIICVCDEQLYCLQSNSLKIVSSLSGRAKSISCMSINQNPVNDDTIGVEFLIGTSRKMIQLFHLSLDYKLSLIKQVSVSEIPICIAVDSWVAIWASSGAYYITDMKSGTSSMLFPYQKGSIVEPFVKRIGVGEFILNGPNALGVFANSQGVSQKPPLTWSPTTFATAFSHPYVLALDDEFLTVHSVLDQIQKQSIPSPGWKHLENTNRKVVVGSSRDLLVALLLTQQQQIKGLLDEKRIDEALAVLDNYYQTNSAKNEEDFFAFKRKTEQKCAFFKLKNREFSEARRLFLSSDLQIETLIGMWPSCSKTSSRFKCKEINIDEICAQNASHFNQYADFYISMIMQYIRSDSVYSETLDACAEILINLYCQTDSVKLFELIDQNFFLPFNGDLVVALLKENKQWHSAALHLNKIFNEKVSLQIWMDLVDNKIEDPLFPGIHFLTDPISKFQTTRVVLDALHWLCEKGEDKLALPLAIERANLVDLDSSFHPSKMVTEFDQHSDFVLRFLEALYKKCDYNVNLILFKRFHRKVHEIKSEQFTEEISYRDRFRTFLRGSPCLNLQEALSYFDNCSCCEEETLILLRRLGLHGKALSLILKDNGVTEFESALDYCEKVQDESGEKLYESLLDRLNNKTLCLELIKRHGNKISPSKTLQYIPDDFKLKDASAHVTKALKCRANASSLLSLRQYATLQVAQDYKAKELEMIKNLGPICIDDNSTCCVCNGPFFESAFVRLPGFNNATSSEPQIVHVTCMTDSTTN